MHDRTVWITGASSGIGAAVAREFARRGARTAITARREQELRAIASDCERASGADVLVAPADVTNADDIAAAHEQVVERMGTIDVAVLCAGAWKPMYARTFDADELARQHDVNVVGTARCIQAVLPRMRSDGRGRIVIVSSLTAFTGLPLAAAYGSSKAAISSMAESLRADLAGTGVSVTTVHPGFVRTPMTENNTFAMPQLMEPEQAARIIVRGIERGRDDITFPRMLASSLLLLRTAPGPIRRRIVARMARPRTNGATR